MPRNLEGEHAVGTYVIDVLTQYESCLLKKQKVAGYIGGLWRFFE